MAVVKNLMIRIGADFSDAKKGMQGASNELAKLKRDATRTTTSISGKSGFGRVSAEFRNMGSTVSSSIARIRGAKGIGGVASEMKNLTPLIGAAASGLSGFSSAATGVVARLGPVGITIGALVAALGIAVVGIYKASQTAAKFESDLGRLNMQLKGSSREFMDWARAQGLAKSTSAELGATYSVLLSSFTKDNKLLAEQTKQMVQATRVVASATGRTIEDTTERLRSGLLGNTEAIEDLGIFVGVSMIESTKAFKKFANGKHWDQLDFRTQQQIRLQAILEQAYDRYGNELQNNVMTKQGALMEQLKDIKLNLSQAFLPIWDTVLPALTKLATALAEGTEIAARFIYKIKGWDYDKLTKGTDQQTDAVKDMGDSYEQAGKQAQKALAPFDEINQLGDSSGGGGTSGSGKIPTPSLPEKKPDTQPERDWIDDLLDKIALIPRVIDMPKINPPSPPDGGAGAVATAWTTTVNSLLNAGDSVKLKWDEIKDKLNELPPVTVLTSSAFSSMVSTMLSDITTSGPYITMALDLITDSLNSIALSAPGAASAFTLMLSQMQTDQTTYVTPIIIGLNLITDAMNGITLSGPVVSAAFKTMLESMQTDTNAYQPYISWGLNLISLDMSNFVPVSALASAAFKTMLDGMQANINAYQPYISWGISLIGASLSALISGANAAIPSWSAAWQALQSIASTYAKSIIDLFDGISKSYERLMDMLEQPIKMPKIELPSFEMPKIASDITDALKDLDYGQVLKDAASKLGSSYVDAMDAFSETAFSKWIADHPELGSGVGIGGVGGAASAAEGGAANITSLLEKFLESLKGAGAAVPALASGGITSGPMLAMIGDNPGGEEVVSPLDELVDIVTSAVGTAMVQYAQLQGSGKDSGDIVINVDGTTLARVVSPYLAKEQQRIGASAIIQPI